MKPATRLCAAALLALAFGGDLGTASAQHPPGNPERLYSRIIVKMKAGAPPAADNIPTIGRHAKAMAHSAAASEVRHFKTIYRDTHVAKVSTPMRRAELAAFAAAMARDPQVDYAEVDEFVQAHAVPNDPDYAARQWNLKAASGAVGGANFVNAWDRNAGGNPVNGTGVVVAVLDTGYRPHGDLAANIVGGYDFVSAALDRDNTSGRDAIALDPGDWDPTDPLNCASSSWHGTHVAGVLAAIANNSVGIAGAAFGVKVLPVRVLGICGGYSSDIQEGMYWAAGLHQANGVTNPNIAKVINLSLGNEAGIACSASYQAAVDAVLNAGVTIVASSGNESSNTAISSPASCRGVIAVTAHSSDGNRFYKANVGAGTAISAPGDAIYSATNIGNTTPVASPGGDSFALKSGTSMAAPHVAAAAALLYQIRPTITPARILNTLQSTARAFAVGYCQLHGVCGEGMLDADAAVARLQSDINAGTNHPPVLDPIADQSATSTGTTAFTPVASDADGDPLAFTISSIPAGASFNSSTGAFSWVNPAVGVYTFTVTASDGLANSLTRTVRITVTEGAAAGTGGGGGSLGWLEICVLLPLLAVRLFTTRRLTEANNITQR